MTSAMRLPAELADWAQARGAKHIARQMANVHQKNGVYALLKVAVPVAEPAAGVKRRVNHSVRNCHPPQSFSLLLLTVCCSVARSHSFATGFVGVIKSDERWLAPPSGVNYPELRSKQASSASAPFHLSLIG
jgi:hypothetical protein